MLDGEGQPGPDTGDTPQGGEAKTTLTGDEAVLAQLQSEIEADEADSGAREGEADDGQPEGDDADDLEDGEKKARVPKWVKEGYLRHQDYTKKTMSAAEQLKAVEAEKTRVAEVEKFNTENLEVITDIRHIDRQLAAYDKLNWEELLQKDAKQHQYHLGKLQLLERQRNQLIGDLQQKQHQALEKQRVESAKLAEDSLARIAKKIPGWSDELAGKLNTYATANGFSMDELQGFIPKKNADAYVSTLHKAYLFDQLMAKTRAKAAPSKDVPAPVPVPKLSSRRSPNSSPEPLDSDPPDVWLKKRNKQLGIGVGRSA